MERAGSLVGPALTHCDAATVDGELLVLEDLLALPGREERCKAEELVAPLVAVAGEVGEGDDGRSSTSPSEGRMYKPEVNAQTALCMPSLL